MPYSTSEAFANRIISLFLYGEASPPADLGREDYLKGARSAVVPVEITMVDFMEGPGRFVRLSHFEMVQKFLDGNVDVSALGVPGVDYTVEAGKIVYNKEQAAQRLGIENRRFAFNQAYFSDGSDDYFDRVFIWGSTSFQLNDDIRFVIDTNGDRYIENAKITLDLSERLAGRPDTNFDFESGSFTEYFEPFIRPVFDPFDIGLSVGINVTGDVAPSVGHYTYDSYVADRDANQYTLGLTNPSIGTTKGTHDFTSDYVAAGAVLAAGGFAYIGRLYERNALRYTQEGYHVFLGTDGSDAVYLGYSDPAALVSAYPHLAYADAPKGAWVVGAGGNDSITGMEIGANRLEGGDGDDELVGGLAGDELHGDEGSDEFHGEGGDDTFYSDADDTVIDGGSGYDTADYSQSDRAINWETVSAQVSSLEVVIGSDFADNFSLPSNLIFPDEATEIRGGKGDDRIRGNDAINMIDGGDDNDNIWGGSDDDVLTGGAGNDNIEGGDSFYPVASDKDKISGGTGDDTIHGGADDDRISGDDGLDNIWGDAGDDIIVGGEGNDRIEGGDDSYLFASDDDNIAAGVGNDAVEGGAGDDKINGQADNDALWGEAGNDLISGGDGDDIVRGGAGNDILLGDADNDILDAARDDGLFDADKLFGGAGADYFITNDHDIVYDLALGDQGVVFEGLRLSGGHLEYAVNCDGNAYGARPEDGVYTGARGETYTYSRSTGTLTVSTGGIAGFFTSTLTIFNFRNGAGGIQLQVDADDEGDCPDPEWPVDDPNQRGRRNQPRNRKTRRDPRIFDNPPISPLVVDLNGDGVSVTSLEDSDVYFDIDNDGMAERTAWATDGDGILALDRNSDGTISNITELFGSPNSNGFDVLAQFDDGGDGLINASDAVYEELRVWVDANQDGVSQETELNSLSALGILSITTAGLAINEFNNGNAVTQRGRVTFVGGVTSNVDDVWFVNVQVDAVPDLPADFALDPLVGALPELAGSGNVANLSVAMSQNAALRDLVAATVISAATRTAQQLRSAIEAILMRWTAAEAVSSTSRGLYANAQHLAVIEALYGEHYRQEWGLNANTDSPGPNAANEIEVLYREILDQTVARFGVQVFNSQLDLAERGQADYSLVTDGGNVFAAISGFTYDIDSDRVVASNLSGTIAHFVEGTTSSSDADLSRIALFMSIVRGLQRDLYGDDSAAFADTLRFGLSHLNDLALTEYALAIATGADVITGTSGAETLDTNDPSISRLVRRLDGISSVLVGGPGADTLSGRTGGDTYVSRPGDGQDLIRDRGSYDDPNAGNVSYGAVAAGIYQGNSGGTDRLLLMGVSSSELSFATVGNNLQINFSGNPNDQIIIQDYFAVSQIGHIEEIVTSDAVLRLEDIPTTFVIDPSAGGPGPNILAGTLGNDIFNGGTGADTYLFRPGSGQDTIVRESDSNSTTDTLISPLNRDQLLITRVGNDLIIKFYEYTSDAEGNVTKVLGFDQLTVVSQYQNIVNDLSTIHGVLDIIRYPDGSSDIVSSGTFVATTNRDAVVLPFNPEDVELSRTSLETGGFGRGRDLQIVVNDEVYATVAGQFNQILTSGTATQRFGTGGSERSRAIIFADGSILSPQDIAEQVPLVGTAAADELIGSQYADVISGGNGNDQIKGFDGDDVIDGGRGDDILQGDSHSSERQPSQPGTSLQPMEFRRQSLDGVTAFSGNDTYIYRRGDGNDTIIDQGRGGLDVDTLKLVDLNPGDVSITRVRLATPALNSTMTAFNAVHHFTTTDLIVTVNSTGETVRVWDQFFDDRQGIELIAFADGTVYDRDYLLNTIPLVVDERGGDELAAYGVIDGGTAYQYLHSFGSDDIALFGSSSSNQTAYAFETVRLKDVNSDTVNLSREGLDLLIRAGADGPIMRVVGHFSEGQPVADNRGDNFIPSLKTIIFANGETWDLSQIARNAGIDGSAGPDSLSGTGGADLLRGFAGDDALVSGNGDDVLVGGSGNDLLAGGVGADRFVADGNDGDDAIDGGDGLDSYDASALASPVTVDLTAGTATGTEIGTDSLVAIEGAIGGRGDDRFEGSANTDTLIGGGGNDVLRGAAGDDLLSGGAGSDIIDGGAGFDTVSYEQARASVTLSLDAGTGSAGEALGDSFLAVENAIGSNYSDTIYGNGGANRLDLGSGNDMAEAGAGDDTVTGGSGADAIWGQAGNDRLSGDAGSDRLNGGEGDDVLSGDAGFDTLDGGAGSDAYVWTLGDGNDFVTDVAASADEVDVLRISGLAPVELRVQTDGNAMFLLAPTGEQITIAGPQSSGSGGAGIEKVVFDDGTEWDRAMLLARAGERPNRTPVAIADHGMRTAPGIGLTIAPTALLGNDFDPDGEGLFITGVSSNSDAAVEIRPDGSIRFTPNPGFAGNTAFTYTVRDPFGAEDSATVSVEVIEGAVPLTVRDDVLDPLAEGASRIVSANSLLSNDMGSGGSSLLINSVGSSVGGQAELQPNGDVRFTADGDFNGEASFAYSVVDGAGNVATATARFEITPVNDPPLVLEALANQNAPEDAAFSIALDKSRFADVDGDVLNFSATGPEGTTLPAWLHFDGSHFTGTPPQDFNGPVGISVTASDGQAQVTAHFVLTIAAVNDAPQLVTALADHSIRAGDSLEIAIPGGTFSDVDGDGLLLSASLVDGSALPSWLHFDGQRLAGTPPLELSGSFDIRITANDGSLTASDILTLVVLAANRAPDAGDDELFVTDQAEALVIAAAELLANDTDPDGNPLHIVSVEGAAHGTVSIAGNGDVVYSPDGSYIGTDSFTYTLSDGKLYDTATVSVRIDNPFATWSQGTDGDDKIFGNMAAANQIFGADGDDQLKGGQQDDWLAGGDGNDHLIGLSGNDHFWGGIGNDLLNGNAGLDVAHYVGLRSTYSVATVDGAVTVVDNAPAQDGNDGIDAISSIEQLEFKNGETASVISPIVLDLDGKGVRTLTSARSKAKFDFDGDARRDDTSWIGRTEGFLFLDRDGNGKLSGAGELSFIDDLPGAGSDLAGLRAFDSNGDGFLSVGDAQFASFRVWRDADGDGNADRGEVLSLSQAGVKSLNLTGTAVNGSTAFGDVAIVNRGSYERTDGTTMEYVDAALTYFSAATKPSLHIDVPGSAGTGSMEEALSALPGSDGGNTISALIRLSDSDVFARFSANPETDQRAASPVAIRHAASKLVEAMASFAAERETGDLFGHGGWIDRRELLIAAGGRHAAR